MQGLEGRVAVITGAAGGLGAALARQAARSGMKLVLADIDQIALQALRDQLAAGGAEILAERCDIRSAAAVDALAAAAEQRFGAVHLLINNAGVGRGGLLWEIPEAEWDWMFAVNVKGTVHAIRAVVPLMFRAARRDPDFEAHVVNVASVAGLVNAPLLGPYNATKHAVVSLSETLHHDLRLCGAPVGVSVLCPHFIRTGIAASERYWPGESPEKASGTPGRALAREVLERSMAHAEITSEQVAATVFDAVRENRFYIFSHPATLPSIGARFDDILSQRPPADPYAVSPSFRSWMRSRLDQTWRDSDSA